MYVLLLKDLGEKLLEITEQMREYHENIERKKKKSEAAEKEQEQYVSLHQFDMLSNAYDAKLDECEKLKSENRKLTEELSKYRYFIECQKNEIEKL